MQKNSVGFDVEGFYQALESTRQSRDISWRAVANEAGISPSTLTRMAQGKRPDVDSLAKLTVWSGLKTDDFVRSSNTKPVAEPIAMISTLLRSDQHLTADSAAALDELVKLAYKRLRKND